MLVNCNKLESNKKFPAGMFLPHFLQILAKQVKKNIEEAGIEELKSLMYEDKLLKKNLKES